MQIAYSSHSSSADTFDPNGRLIGSTNRTAIRILIRSCTRWESAPNPVDVHCTVDMVVAMKEALYGMLSSTVWSFTVWILQVRSNSLNSVWSPKRRGILSNTKHRWSLRILISQIGATNLDLTSKNCLTKHEWRFNKASL